MISIHGKKYKDRSVKLTIYVPKELSECDRRVVVIRSATGEAVALPLAGDPEKIIAMGKFLKHALDEIKLRSEELDGVELTSSDIENVIESCKTSDCRKAVSDVIRRAVEIKNELSSTLISGSGDR